MQILIPIAGHSAFFPKKDFFFPKPLIEVAGRPMIELVATQLRAQLPKSQFTFVLDKEAVTTFSLDKSLRLACGPDTQIVERLAETSGALCSCLLACGTLDPEAPLIISNSDQVIAGDIARHIGFFQDNDADAGVLSFDSVHPRWSYVVAGPGQQVLQTFEKKVVSRHAIAGLYYFSSARAFFDAAQQVMLNDVQVDGTFYLSSALNEVILKGGEVLHAPIGEKEYHSFYAPGRIENFERSALARRLREQTLPPHYVNVIIPAAGEGSRFANAGWKKPKPFLDVMGEPMLNHVIANVTPQNAQTTILLRQEHMEAQPKITQDFENRGIAIHSVAKLTEGTACTVLLARKRFDTDQPMMVANSDQLVDFDVTDYVRDCLERDLDGSILVFRDPGKDPKWSFAKVNAEGLVTEVAEKKPISDLATVGIYLFTKGSEFVSAAVDMIAENDRVNGEFYTCPVYNYMIRNGARIGVYEVPMDAMSGLGTPDDLTDFLAARGADASQDVPD